MANKQVKFIEDFPLVPQNILTSFDVFGMNSTEFGIYCKLLFISWIQKPRQCYLRYDEENICGLCKITPEDWQECKNKVLKKFKTEIYLGETFIYNKVLLDKWNEEINKINFSKGKQLSSLSDLLNYTFDEFWKDYDKKTGDQRRMVPKWMKLSDEDRERIRVDIPKRKEAQPDKQFRPSPEKYLNGRLWENEIIYYNNKKPQKENAADYNGQKSNPV